MVKTSISGSSYVTIAYNVNVDDGECTKPVRTTHDSSTCKIMQSFSRDSTILLSSSDTKHTPFDASKPIYIGVYGATNPESMYTLLVTSDNGNITLIDGMPQVGEVLKNARHFYRLETEGNTADTIQNTSQLYPNRFESL